MSTFSGLNTAFTGLNAARQGLDVVGQNIANSGTTGYTRQRVSTAAAGSLTQIGPLVLSRAQVGRGVTVDGIARLGDVILDGRVRSSAATSGNLAVRSNALSSVEAALNEPSTTGISAQLNAFWSAWGDVSNRPGDEAPAGVLLQKATQLAGQIATGYSAVDSTWTDVRTKLDGMAAELNDAGTRVAALNGAIRDTLATGGSVNEMLDQRSALTSSIAALTGGTVRTLPDGTAEVLVGGNALVSGDVFRSVTVTGSNSLAGASGSPVTLEWTNRPGQSVAVESGEIAGSIAMLAAANGTGTGGAIAEAAAGYNAFATALANTVNTAHQAGATPSGATGLDFFTISATGPAALGLSVVPTGAAQIASGTPGAGGNNGSNAEAISQLGSAPNSPDSVWSTFVTKIGTTSKTALQQATLADSVTAAATAAQLANSSVDLDEENVNMLTFQKAYQGAARVMTAVDEMLDTLINHTGIVGR
ncbi:flagellar hook-associated protein FlgK [Glaciihabitans sp. INWT7]|uniref:flagellar hook-associated protein FlgK n=1 Tax=Glaciihabitans sp. INWT7 TaxID=2596912 RepID=UPI00162A7319|nr:flagellar hook-associated protein FlgK [Glaciihabitans sp. INWT7]QNE48211.1 flagellar hook-associated protein FlgK [Glaciihabitans sp. INWT7]